MCLWARYLDTKKLSPQSEWRIKHLEKDCKIRVALLWPSHFKTLHIGYKSMGSKSNRRNPGSRTEKILCLLKFFVTCNLPHQTPQNSSESDPFSESYEKHAKARPKACLKPAKKGAYNGRIDVKFAIFFVHAVIARLPIYLPNQYISHSQK